MCHLGLHNKKEASKWLIEHHPDQGGKATSVDVGRIATCMKQREFCTRKQRRIKNGSVGSVKPVTTAAASGIVAPPPSLAPWTWNPSWGSKTRKNKNIRDAGEKNSVNRIFQRVHRVSSRRDNVPEAEKVVAAYKPSARQLDCVRQVSNWSKIGPANRFDKTRFDNKATDKLIPIASPKLEAMLQNIAALDANDMALHGKKFKHFIFSDIKMMGYGAKIISAAFITRGLKPVLRFNKSKIVLDVPKGDGDKFAVLSSTPLWDSPFTHKLKKEVLDMYNKRPDNVYGETCRFIILDSGFKEGIDLFDVRYVHLFEPLMTEADMTQALGRATRLCGQKGLDFVPNAGWPLNVYKYSQSIPEQLQGPLKAKNLFEIALQLKGLDTRLHSISKAIKDVSILAAVDQPLTDEIHKSGLIPRIVVKKMTAAEEKKAESESGLTGKGTVRSLPITISMELTQTVTDMTHTLARTNMAALLDKFEKAGSKGQGNPSAHFRLDDKNTPLQKFLLEDKVRTNENVNTLEAIADSDPSTSVASSPCTSMSGAIVPFYPSRHATSKIIPTVVMETGALVVRVPTKIATASVPKTIALLHDKVGSPSKQRPTSWFDLRRYVLEKYATMAWPVQQVINKCIDKPGPPVVLKKDPKDYIVEPKRKTLPLLKLVDYTPTQEFISSYFTAASSIKGMLLWHSVGTGKTCSAIALASSQFEPEGYSIIWVTRHTLKADIWKNVFDFVCHKTIAQEVREGKLAPEDVEKRQRRMGQQWIPPMSYRQFSNIVQGKNPIYEVLKKRNGKADPLKKTLIIIDEAHKLYSADFKGAEKPDVPAFMKALQNSYKVSGPDSARVLLMTATPYNESPMELMKLLNLCREEKDHLPEEMPKFIEKYMDATGNFTQDGLLSYMNAIAGQISYLNREADPSQFAQPIFADIVVPISTYDDVNPGDNKEITEINADIEELVNEKRKLEEEVIPHLQAQVNMFGPAMDTKLAECQKQFVGKPKDLKACLARVNKTYKDALKLEERNLKNSIKRVDVIEKKFGVLKKKTASITKKLKKSGTASLTQQAQLETRCKIGV